METNEESSSVSSGNEDIDKILQQFNCLCTTDKEVLVLQLQRLIGPELNSSAAGFFLDMNNWNLQSAVGSYFDLISNDKLKLQSLQLKSTVINDDINENINVPPYTKFIKSFKIVNNGGEQWPAGSYLKFKNGQRMSVQTDVYINPIVMPGDTRQINIEFLSPQQPGNYNTNWQMCTPEGILFGDEIWILVNVQLMDDEFSLVDKLNALSTCENDMC